MFKCKEHATPGPLMAERVNELRLSAYIQHTYYCPHYYNCGSNAVPSVIAMFTFINTHLPQLPHNNT